MIIQNLTEPILSRIITFVIKLIKIEYIIRFFNNDMTQKNGKS